MRVLHVIPCLDPATGGPARSVPALCTALQAAGVENLLYTFRRPGASATVTPGDEQLAIRWFVPFGGSRQLPTRAFYQSLRQDARRFDLAHLHSFWNPCIDVAALACRQAGLPYVLSARGMLQEGALQRRRTLKSVYHWLWARRTLASARALHFFTEAEAKDSARLVGPETRRMVIPSGIASAVGAGVGAGRFRDRYPQLSGKRIVLFMGRLHWSKGLDVQARAMKLLAGAAPNAIWVLVGPDAGEWARLSRQIADLGLERHVLWTGLLPREQCLEALTDADVFLLTSRHEAHSAAMNEALAVGVPVVLTDTVQFDEVEQWGAGRVVPARPDRLAEAIEAILADPRRSAAMRQAGPRLVAERLAWPKVAEATAQAYAALVADRG